MPRFSSLVDRVAGPGADAWENHLRAVEAQKRGEDVIVLSVGDPDLDTPALIVDKAIAALRNGDTHYADVPGRRHLREAIADRHAAAVGQTTEWRNVLVTSGAQNALFVAAQLILEPGDEVLVFEPAYVTYPALLGAAGATIINLAPLPGSGFRVDQAGLDAAVSARTKAIFFSNPNNPAGTILNSDERAAILELAIRHDLWIVADEVYGDLVFKGGFVPFAAQAGAAERVLTVGSLSKSHAMTGWRTGWLVGPRELIDHGERLALAMLYGLPGFIQEAAYAAIVEATDVPRAMTAIYAARAAIATTALEGVPGLSVLPPTAGMFMMIDVGATGLNGAQFAASLFNSESVSVLDGAAFGRAARDHIRISFAASENAIVEGCQRIRNLAEHLLLT
jgi:aspartate/methionine/tyrosine aminotransferase